MSKASPQVPLKPKTKKKSVASKRQPPSVFKRKLFLHLSLRSKIMFIKQLSILIKAGVPLLSALHMLKDQSKSKTMVYILGQVIKHVEGGQYLAVALGKFKKIFGELTINIIEIGEISGNLSSNLSHLAVTLKKNQALRRKIVSASVYPLFIMIATLTITVLLTVFFFPKIIPILKSVNYDLPWTTKTLIFISDSTRNHGLFLLGAIMIVMVGIFLLLKNKKIHFWYNAALLRIPLLRRLIQTYNAANICRTLGLLLSSGIVVVKSFEVTSNTTTNVVYKKELSNIAKTIAQGGKISTHMHRHPALFPVTMTQMIAVGEATGKLSETFSYVADIYEEEMDDFTKNLSTSVEPLLLIFMGLLVGFVAISIITPIYGITQHLSPR